MSSPSPFRSRFRHGVYPFGLVACLMASLACAKGPFDGLEMDVIAPGQTPKGPTARIALPRGPGSGPLAIDGAAAYEDSIADSLIRGDSGERLSLTGGKGDSIAPPEAAAPMNPSKP